LTEAESSTLISGAVLLALLQLLASSVEFDLDGGIGLIIRPPPPGRPKDEHKVEEDRACVSPPPLSDDGGIIRGGPTTDGVGVPPATEAGLDAAPNCTVLLLCLK